mgnify:CR=1 FL=1
MKTLGFGIGLSGVAAAELLVARGGRVVAVDSVDNAASREAAARLRAHGVRVELGVRKLPLFTPAIVRTSMKPAKVPSPSLAYDFAVISPGVPLDNPLVVDKWFSVQAGAARADTIDRVRRLKTHDLFTVRNPNRARALIAAFAMRNLRAFHEIGRAHV